MKMNLLSSRAWSVSCLCLLLSGVVSGQALENSPFGWATSGGSVTGGGSATPVTVSSNSAFRSAVSGNSPKVVQVSGTIDLGIASWCDVGSNTTIIGLGTNATLLHGGLSVTGESNVIIRNLHLEDARDPNWECETPTEGGQPSNCTSSNAAYDILHIQSSSRIWVDHCSFENHQTNELAYDGELDINGGSDYITISYCVFSESRKTNLIGSSDSDTGSYRITWAYNWWNGTSSRNPMTRFARTHMLNNYYTNVSSYCIGIRINSRIYAEGNYFLNCSYPSTLGDASGQLRDVGNSLVNCSPSSMQGTVSSVGWTPSYSYTALSASQVPSHVQSNAGAGNISSSCTPTSITPYVQVNGGSWQQTSSVTVSSGASVKFGPHPTQGGSWSWSGCGTSGSSREQTVTVSSSCTATATYTNSSGCQSTQNFNVTISGGGSSEIAINENETGFCGVDGSIDTNHSGYQGSGFANTSNSSGSGIDWSVSIPSTGSYVLRWRYANGTSSNRPGNVIVDGSTVSSATFPGTGAWDSWSENSNSEVTVTLSAGTRSIRLEATSSSGLANIDKIEVEGSSPSAASCSGGSRFAAPDLEDDAVSKIAIYPNPFGEELRFQLPELEEEAKVNIFNSVGQLAGKYTLTNSDERIHLGELKSGIYFVEIQVNGIRQSLKVVKR